MGQLSVPGKLSGVQNVDICKNGKVQSRLGLQEGRSNGRNPRAIMKEPIKERRDAGYASGQVTLESI